MGRGGRIALRGIGAALIGLAAMGLAREAISQDVRPRAPEAKPIEVTPDLVANMWRAASQGDTSAQITLGFFYEQGQGVAPSLDEAAMWYEKAAAAGAPRGAHLLGLLHSRGDWPLANPVAGFGWLDTAIGLGRGEAEAARDRLATRLTPGERAVGERFAREKIAEIKARTERSRR